MACKLGPHFSSLEETLASLIQTDHETSVEGGEGKEEEKDGGRAGEREGGREEEREGGREGGKEGGRETDGQEKRGREEKNGRVYVYFLY